MMNFYRSRGIFCGITRENFALLLENVSEEITVATLRHPVILQASPCCFETLYALEEDCVRFILQFSFHLAASTSNVNEKKCKSPSRALWKLNFHMNRMCLRNMAAKPNARVSEYAISSTCGGLRAGAKFMIYLKCFLSKKFPPLFSETEFAKGIEMEFI